jgi:hypothetical protein
MADAAKATAAGGDLGFQYARNPPRSRKSAGPTTAAQSRDLPYWPLALIADVSSQAASG